MSRAEHIAERVHASGKQLVIALTGGGSRAIAELLEVPGGSASVLEAVVPYSSAALDDWLGGAPEQYCSEQTARWMAMGAFERARKLAEGDPGKLRGIGLTASLVSNRAKRGAHRVHVAWQSAETTSVTSCELEKGGTRAEEESIAAALALGAIAEACGAGILREEEPGCARFERRWHTACAEWSELLLGLRDRVWVGRAREERPTAAGDGPTVLFPGAFNPLHEGHRAMARIAGARRGAEVVYEISLVNVDKRPLDFLELAQRAGQFTGAKLLLTRAATFVEKARLVPGCWFVVGADTIARIADPKYYAGSAEQRDAAVHELARLGCRFLVFGRAGTRGFQQLESLRVPPALGAICEQVPESEFRMDVSSTQRRGAAEQAPG